MQMKNKLFTMKVTQEEKGKWKELAKSYNINLSELVRQRLNETPLGKIIKYKTADPKLVRAVNAIGNNLNQISKRVNENEKFNVEIEIKMINKHLEQLLNAYKIS